MADLEAHGAIAELINYPDDLVARRDKWSSRQEIAFGKMQIGPADPTAQNPNTYLAPPRRGDVTLEADQWALVDSNGTADPPCAHAHISIIAQAESTPAGTSTAHVADPAVDDRSLTMG